MTSTSPSSASLDRVRELRASTQRYVRSQVQVAEYKEGAKGRVLSAYEVYRAFGLDALAEIETEGAYPLVVSSLEPAATLAKRRDQMGITVEQLARAANVSPQMVRDGETPSRVLPIRILEKLARHLALDESVLGHIPFSRGDKELGVRLRELKDNRDAMRLSHTSVLKLAEAAWVIGRQAELADSVGESTFKPFAKPDTEYGYPAWRHGYRLAAATRSYLGLSPLDPIKSLRILLENRLSIPLVQQDLGMKFAGATLANGKTRGIVVNQEGANSNVWVRRMTLCHELGHLLWDDNQRLNRLTVDGYDDMSADYAKKSDPVEIRANAFAISFLAPPQAVKKLFDDAVDDRAAMFELVNTYGISFTAAKYHSKNVLSREVDFVDGDAPHPTAEWDAAENLAVDFFPIAQTPITRRGRFASLVVSALRQGVITSDTADSLLDAPSGSVADNADTILDLTS